MHFHSSLNCPAAFGNAEDLVFRPPCRPPEVARGPWVFVRCAPAAAHDDSIVIATDGARLGSHWSYSRAAIGVYVGAGSAFNRAAVLEPAVGHSKQRAVLVAAICALDVALDIVWRCRAEHDIEAYISPGGLRRVVIKADSTYLVRGMTRLMPEWRRNEFCGAGGRSVFNADLFRRLDGLVYTLGLIGVSVFFWRVVPEDMFEVYRLANDALSLGARTREAGESSGPFS